MRSSRRGTIGRSGLMASTVMLLVCCPGASLAEDTPAQDKQTAEQPSEATARVIPSARRFQPTLPSIIDPAAEPQLPPDNVSEVVQAVREKLSASPKLAQDLAKSEVEALQAFYGARGREALWVNEEGISANGQALIAEFGKADDYGLSASDYKVANKEAQSETPQSRAQVELDLSATALVYARHVKGGRTSPNAVGAQLTYTPKIMEPLQVLNELSSADDSAAYLRSLHPQHPQYVRLYERLKELRGGDGGSGPKIPDGPVLKSGVSRAQVTLLRERLGVSAPTDGSAKRFDAALDEAVKAFQSRNGLPADGVVGAGTRRALNGQAPDKISKKIVLNLERWRWLPDNLGGKAGLYVWANIPELRVRAVEGTKTVFSEKAIVGQPTHMTPVFSDQMEWIELHPTWFVPNSIKVNDILPSLKRPTSTVMERYHLKVNCGKYGTNPKTIDWNKVDIRKCSFSQPAGKVSVLGDFKFKFPNKHSVYMHDTHDHSLFKHADRTFSHGCIRVQKPRQLAEIILGRDKGMTSERIGQILDGPQTLHKEKLTTPVPMHITYFTVLIDDEGKLTTWPDYYGHDQRLEAALSGESHNVAEADVPPEKVARKKPAPKEPTSWWGGVFSAN